MRFVRTFGMSLRCGALALAGAFIAGGSALAQEPIRIGAFLSVTGPASFLGDPEQKTLEMLIERINAEGGVLGRKLQLVSYDDGGDAEKARTFAKRLLEQDRVDDTDAPREGNERCLRRFNQRHRGHRRARRRAADDRVDLVLLE